MTEIKEKSKVGMGIRKLAREYGMARQTI